jgi:excinuclease ABC subunit A
MSTVIPDPGKSLAKGAVAPWSFGGRMKQLAALRALGVDLDTPWQDLPEEHRALILHGDDVPVRARHESSGGSVYDFNTTFVNVERSVRRSYAEAESDAARERLERFMHEVTCSACRGARLKREALLVTVGGRSIAELMALTLDEQVVALAELEASLEGEPREIAGRIVRELRTRLGVLIDLGLGYLTLDRAGPTLSGGETQRLKLATQTVSGVVNVLYVLDEPSIGLHPRDTQRLLGVLARLRDTGNSLLVVEHDEATIRAADWVVEIGPGAGEEGGAVVAAGSVAELTSREGTLTGDWLSGRRRIAVPAERRTPTGALHLVGAHANNLAGIDVEIPLGVLVAVTGVSGSGKSTLVGDLLHPALAARLGGSERDPGGYDALEGADLIDRVLHVDQSPIGRSPRSNPATYTGLFDGIRKLFAAEPLARDRGYDAGRFSFNVKGGRCEACDGAGAITLDMQFLADAHYTCDACHGRRYEPSTLEVRYRDHSIADVLALQVRDALELFADRPAIARPLATLADVGLGYLRLGQPAPTLSGGEAQRVKLATELQRRSTGRTLYLLDEPTIGLHPADVQQLLGVIDRLVAAGNTVLVIEHDLDLVKCADHVIDLGPEGGPGGGRLVAAGTPEEVARVAASHTGRALAPLLA